ncbi:major facilitator superfamily domain-containing protein [Aspergillus alliaceus]|uniref:Major facilitator superfamily domain-containing protein n=1 Tax=Petromyces alliaceus TaxID=209559 RepID=A0A5N6G9N9_PETAA|nr:major facilitator superfamily domain-containing protein [Aspergillus alliaceus]KAB8237969.1 major facilitator superfamily domain-containing protein [Aspergillus alliaceus]KAE8386234.1 major facilitator superfamily domain-containing protein [Aspergillus alliaceus]
MIQEKVPEVAMASPASPLTPNALHSSGHEIMAAALPEELKELESRLRWKVDLRLCTIAGILCSLNLLDSGILSSASVTSMLNDLDLGGTRYSVSIFIFTITSVVFQLPCTMAVRWVGPRIWFASITFCFGLLTLCTAFVQTWKQLIALRVLLGMAMSGIYPGLTYLISTWYTRREQQLRFAFLQSGEVTVLATGTIVNYGLNHLDGRAGLRGWRWMFLVQGLVTCVIGIVTYWWMIDFPEKAHRSFYFLSESEAQLAVQRIQADRDDVVPEPFSWRRIGVNFLDPKLYGFACMFFILNLVSTALAYFLPIILQSGMGFSSNAAIILSTPPYYWSVIPALFTSFVGDTYRLRGPMITFNALCLIAGFLMFGLPTSTHVTVRYIGTFLATGAYVSNWAALNAFMANNVAGQWKRATTAAAVSACNGLGGVAGSWIVRQREAPRYETAVWVSVGYVLIRQV